MDAQQVFQRSLPTVRILYGALVFSTLLLAFAAFMMKLGVPEPPAQALEAGMAMVALALTVASFVLPRIVGANAAKTARVEILPAEPGYAGAGTPARFADPAGAARRAMALGQTTFILKMALSEAVSCIGVVMHSLGAPHMHVIPFFVLGTTLAAIRFPTPDNLVSDFERVKGASFATSMDGIQNP
jgi:hypothetical protein